MEQEGFIDFLKFSEKNLVLPNILFTFAPKIEI